MQVLGAYGYRGIIQRKGHFLSSIPYATRNIRPLLDNPFREAYPELTSVLEDISEIEKYNRINDLSDKLIVEINSFSYKKNGCPLDLTENGGGFVFDCRSLPNPGRIAALKDYTGKQEPVIEYLENKAEMQAFLEDVSRLVSQSIDNYLERKFTHLQVNFGCTGGKHRSVFSAEKLRSLLESRYDGRISILLKHTMLND
jgi:RNase adaptor protein for sRNA GlmZ degradation